MKINLHEFADYSFIQLILDFKILISYAIYTLLTKLSKLRECFDLILSS